MAILTKIESAIALGVGIDLLDWFIEKCPKPDETRKLTTTKVGKEQMIDEAELESFRRYLREPWPVKVKNARPSIPDKIKKDIKQEAHLACAICGHMDNGEVAHIEAVKKTYNNSPDNLIFLCPNHHTKFDLGFKPANNVTDEEVLAAKLVKRQSRARMMRVEADVTKAYLVVLAIITKLKKQIDGAAGSAVSKIYFTEVKSLLDHSARLGEKVASASKSGTTDSELQKHLRVHAPTITRLSAEGLSAKTSGELAEKVSSVVDESLDLLEALDEVDCPRCGGRGTTGLIGDWCKYCRGSQQVTSARADAYNPDDVDEQECPHCGGQGTTGLVGDYCAYCQGSQLVSSQRAAAYSADDVDAVMCPRCDGRGTVGLVGDHCSYCRGSCLVSRKKRGAYDEDELDEVMCPRCEGRGTTGLVGDYCAFCGGSQVVSREKASAYDEDSTDQVECPHCNGNGTVGLNGTYCAFCKGSQLISQTKAEAYDPDELDEVVCPRCEGAGTTGFAGDVCKLCRGEQKVTEKMARQFESSRRRS